MHFYTFRGRMILSPPYRQKGRTCTADGSSHHQKCHALRRKRSAASSASLITETGWQRLSSGLIELTSSPTHFFSQKLCSLDFLFLFYVPAHERNDSLSSETFQCFMYVVLFIIHFDMFLFPVVMYRQIQFNHTAIVYCLNRTMIQYFLYGLSNACETSGTRFYRIATHPRKAFISQPYPFYICYI